MTKQLALQQLPVFSDCTDCNLPASTLSALVAIYKHTRGICPKSDIPLQGTICKSQLHSHETVSLLSDPECHQEGQISCNLIVRCFYVNGTDTWHCFTGDLLLHSTVSKIRKNIYRYGKISNIRGIKLRNLNVSRLVLQLSLRNLLKPSVKSGMKMYLEQRRQAMLQLHLSG